MRQKSNSTPASSETLVRNIRRATRKHHAAEEKIRIVLDGLRGETSIAELCRREGIAESNDMRRMRLDKCSDCLGVRSYHSFAFDLSGSIDDADRCQFQRHVQSDILLHCGSP